MSKQSAAPSDAKPKIPGPAHPHRRREPLPWHQPKSTQDDPDAPRRIQAILDSASYREADHDVDFLQRDETRGLRLGRQTAQPSTGSTCRDPVAVNPGNP
jgi:hypothetical protein